MLKQLESCLLRLFRVAIGLAFAVLILAVLVQVIGRMVGTSPVWTEELTRFALLYIAAIGAGLAYRSGDLVNVDVVCEAFGDAWARRFRLLGAVLSAGMCMLLIVPAWKFVAIGALQTSPAMGLKMTFVHFSVLALLIILMLFVLLRILRMTIAGEDGRPESMKDSL